MATELQQIQQFYQNYNIPLSTEWLESCIEWCKDGNLPPNYSVKDLQTAVFEQWLILDLRDVEITSLPRNLSNEKKYTLTGTYALQVMQVVDISKPKLWQLQRIRNNVAKNTEAEKDFGKRCLQLTLTDGVQEVEAMEFKPIPYLNINLSPGTKIKIFGPIMVRNGRLMLQKEDMKVLGGSVDEIKVQYAAENVLARALKLKENPNPHPIDEKALEVTEENTAINQDNPPNQLMNHNQNYQPQQRNNPNIKQNNTNNNQNIPKIHQNISHFQKTQNTSGNYRQNIQQEIPPEFQVDDELLRELEADFEENPVANIIRTKTSINSQKTNTKTINERPFILNQQSKRSRDCNSPDLFDETGGDDDLFNEHLEHLDLDHMASVSNDNNISSSTKSTKVLQNNEITSSNNIKTETHFDDKDIIILDDSFEDIDLDSHLDDIDKEMLNLPSSTQVRNDFKDRIKSPELKSKKNSSDNSKKLLGVESVSLSGKKLLSDPKKLTQGTLNFNSLKTEPTNVPSTSKDGINVTARLNLNSTYPEQDDNPFSIFKRPLKILKTCRASSVSQESLSLVQKTPPNIPEKTSNMSSPDFEFKQLPSTSKQPQNAGLHSENLEPLFTEGHLTSPPTSSKTGNVLTIERLKKMLPNIGRGKFKIKAKFKATAEKLVNKNGSYHYVIIVEDMTGELTVQMHSDLVASLGGSRPDEMEKLKVLAMQQNEDVKRQIIKFLTNLHERCLNLNDVLEIQVTRGEKYPVLTSIL